MHASPVSLESIKKVQVAHHDWIACCVIGEPSPPMKRQSQRSTATNAAVGHIPAQKEHRLIRAVFHVQLASIQTLRVPQRVRHAKNAEAESFRQQDQGVVRHAHKENTRECGPQPRH